MAVVSGRERVFFEYLGSVKFGKRKHGMHDQCNIAGTGFPY